MAKKGQKQKKYSAEFKIGVIMDMRGRPPKLDRKVEEDLIAENQRLRMEIEYLKKLDALVRKREQEEQKKR